MDTQAFKLVMIPAYKHTRTRLDAAKMDTRAFKIVMIPAYKHTRTRLDDTATLSNKLKCVSRVPKICIPSDLPGSFKLEPP